MRKYGHLKRLLAVLLLLGMIMSFMPWAAGAEGTAPKTVQVGWFDSSFCYYDTFGRRCGLAYEYQQKISAYTGWEYEYVEGSWSRLFQMLKDGEIDLLSDVSKKPGQEEQMYFANLPMGTESYYIYIPKDNREMTANNLASFNGKRIGVNAGSIQEGFLRDWAEENGITIEVFPLETEEDESMEMVTGGELDGYATIYSVSSQQDVVPVCWIGGSDYFFAVNKGRKDLLDELNAALSVIHDEDPYFNKWVSEERVYVARSDAFLTAEQTDWIEAHGAIRVGYVENYMPFCQKDSETGELTGALKDYLTHAENNLGNGNIRFDTKAYPSTKAALDAMMAGEIDCVFPVSLTSYDADMAGIRVTSPAMKTGMNEVIRDSDSQGLSRESKIKIALTKGNVNVRTFIMEEYPDCTIDESYADDKACFEAVSSGKADCMLMSNYRIAAAEEMLNGYRLFSAPTGEHIHFSFAVNKANRELYFILNKTVAMTQSEDMDSALASYMHTGQKVTFAKFLKDNWLMVIGALAVVFAVIVILLTQRMKVQRKADEQQRQLEKAAEVAELKQTITSLLDNMPGMNCTKDAQTGVYLACNQAFAEYARKKDPAEVIGRTDAELFDAETAKRIAEDDQVALSMDEPYIFFEDLTDEAGIRRQIKTTKQKYTDATGRLCVLGVSQDITDSFHIRRGDAATKESYEKARISGAIYTHIAQGLARGYTDLYYIDLNSEQYIEYRPDTESGSLTEIRRGWHFFEACQEETDEFVYPEDREAVKKALDRKTLVGELDRNDIFVLTYRLKGETEPTYVNIRVTRMKDDDRYIVLGVTNVDDQMKQHAAEMRESEERIAYARMSALAGDFLCVYVVDPETSHYREFSASAGYGSFAQAKEGTDFFATTREAAREFSHPDDLNRFLAVFTKENVMAEIERRGMFTVSYRLMMKGQPRYFQMKAVIVEEKEGQRLIVGMNDIDSQVRQEEKYATHLAKARIEANMDALTGVKNRHAYLMAEERLNGQIAEDPDIKFAITVLDLNDLKKVNDLEGHNAGDQYIREACRMICNTFKHSPVFRIGGDEFAVISQGSDYECIEELTGQMAENNRKALENGGIVIACGMAKRAGEDSVAPVFERADENMYENKTSLKNS